MTYDDYYTAYKHLKGDSHYYVMKNDLTIDILYYYGIVNGSVPIWMNSRYSNNVHDEVLLDIENFKEVINRIPSVEELSRYYKNITLIEALIE